jgi:predicted dinucleotide-binding enzyme
MKIGVLGTGMVGETLATKLVEIGHEVKMGSRMVNHEGAVKWVTKNGSRASQGTFAQAAAFGEILFNCTNGANSVAALRQADAANMRGKILIEVSNPLDFSKGMPPTLTVCNNDSLGEQIQREFPETQVVKALNTVNCAVMVQPSLVPGDHQIFVCGNNAGAKAMVIGHIAEWFGWKAGNIIDLGDITSARAMEMWMPIWLRLYAKLGTAAFNLRLVMAKQ